MNQRLTVRLLEKQGHAVVPAASGCEGVEQGGAGRFADFALAAPLAGGGYGCCSDQAAGAARTAGATALTPG